MAKSDKIQILEALFNAGRMSADELQKQKAKLIAPGMSVGGIMGCYELLGPIRGGMAFGRHIVPAYAKRQGDVELRFCTAPHDVKSAFAKEAAILSMNRHPNLRVVYDLVTDGDRFASVGPIQPSKTLQSIIPLKGMRRKDAMTYLKPIAEALDCLNAMGITAKRLRAQDICLDNDDKPIIQTLSTIDDDLGSFSPTHKWMLEEARQAGMRADLMAWSLLAQELLIGKRKPLKLSKKRGGSMPLRLIAAAFGMPDTDVNGSWKLDSCQDLIEAMDDAFPDVGKKPRKAELSKMLRLDGFDATKSFSTATLVIGRQSLEFVLLPGGPVKWMGREFHISTPYFISKTPIHQSFWNMISIDKTSHFVGKDLPVERVCWHESIRFCNALSDLSGLEPAYRINRRRVSIIEDSNGFRLPIEIEWLAAALAGKQQRYSGSDTPDTVAWYDENSLKRTHPVGTKQSNSWNIHDLCGNVWEWCWDVYSANLPFDIESLNDYSGPEQGEKRVCRGGSWKEGPAGVDVYVRMGQPMSIKRSDIGFRLALTPLRP